MPFINSLHRKKHSGELDVFEAARYFSGANENATPFSQSLENMPHPGKKSASRLSLDMPAIIALDRKTPKENNKKPHKQPSSPGGKLIATLMNSIFNQSASKKKKPKSSETCKTDGGEIRRKRRSSMSHFTSSDHSSKTTDPCAKTPMKSSYEELLFSKFPVTRPGNEENPGGEKPRIGGPKFGLSEKSIWNDDKDDESDSSSDLFDLPMISNELDFFSRGIPVFGTTHRERIRAFV